MLNAFQSVRPKGQTSTSLGQPVRTPLDSNGDPVVLAFDRNGRRTVGLAPRAKGAITIENRVQSQASVDKRRRISKMGTK